jgi:NAD(P)-dependent dehydrogenase (short-subunit alcohol dehydrogenase family)
MKTAPSPLENKTALVTGGARGLGRALCEALGEAGVRVALVDMRADLAERTSRALTERGHRIMHGVVDITDERQVSACLAAVRERFGSIDILINNAGIDYTQPIDELEISQWDQVMATNVRGPFLLCKHVVGQMKSLGAGHIINVASTAAKRTWPNACAYHASKWALLGFSHALHAELRPHGIRVTAVIAGGMRTGFLLDRFPSIDPNLLQPPEAVADAILKVLEMPPGSVVAEISVLPMGETSWP